MGASSAGRMTSAGWWSSKGNLLQAQELPLCTERAENRRWWAWALLRRGGESERERARALLGEALALYEQMGLTRHREQAASMLAEL